MLLLSAGDLASVLMNEVVGELAGELADFFIFDGELFLLCWEDAASDSEFVTMGLPWAAC